MTEMLLFGISTLLNCTVLAQFLHSSFVSCVLRHMFDVRLDIVASLKGLPSLLVVKILCKFVQPCFVICLSVLCSIQWFLIFSTGSLRPLLLLLALNVHEWLLLCIVAGFHIDKG